MRIVDKPWGHEEILIDPEIFKTKYGLKRLVIKKGEMFSLQHHNVKDETMLVESGKGQLQWEQPYEQKSGLEYIGKDDVFHIKPMTKHRLIAIEELRVLEVSTPEWDDVVRWEDKYGRADIKNEEIVIAQIS